MPLTPPHAAYYSTFEAVSPAIARTHAILFREFRFRRFLKLTCVASLSQYPVLSHFFAFLLYAGVISAFAIFAVHKTAPIHPETGSIIFGIFTLVVAIVFLAITLALANLFTRMRMAMIGIVANRDTEVSFPIRDFDKKSWKYLGLILVVAILFLVPIALIMVPAIYHLVVEFEQLVPFMKLHGADSPAEFIPLILGMQLGLYAAIFLSMILLNFAESTTRDLLMIPLALKDATLHECIVFLRRLLRLEAGRTAGHILFHALLEFAGTLMAALLAYIPALILGYIAAVVGLGLTHALWHNGSGGEVLVIVFAATAAVAVLAVLLVMAVSALGTEAIFTQSHALEYLSRRYTPLDALMYPHRISSVEFSHRVPPFSAPSAEPPPAGTF